VRRLRKSLETSNPAPVATFPTFQSREYTLKMSPENQEKLIRYCFYAVGYGEIGVMVPSEVASIHLITAEQPSKPVIPY
jgi:hypothetical protein